MNRIPYLLGQGQQPGARLRVCRRIGEKRKVESGKQMRRYYSMLAKHAVPEATLYEECADLEVVERWGVRLERSKVHSFWILVGAVVGGLITAGVAIWLNHG